MQVFGLILRTLFLLADAVLAARCSLRHFNLVKLLAA